MRRLPPEALDLERLTAAQRREICAAAIRDATDDARPTGKYPELDRALRRVVGRQRESR